MKTRINSGFFLNLNFKNQTKKITVVIILTRRKSCNSTKKEKIILTKAKTPAVSKKEGILIFAILIDKFSSIFN